MDKNDRIKVAHLINKAWLTIDTLPIQTSHEFVRAQLLRDLDAVSELLKRAEKKD